jgi:AcrR family transcriptional regulator
MGLHDSVLTVAEIADKLRVKTDTVRRLFRNEAGVIVIASGRRRKRTYRTLRIPPDVLLRVLTRLTAQFRWRLEDLQRPIFTIDEIAQTLRIGPDTVRRLLVRVEGVLVISFPIPGKRAYRTLRIPERALSPVVARLTPCSEGEFTPLVIARSSATEQHDSDNGAAVSTPRV